jgi:hypothetical protein
MDVLGVNINFPRFLTEKSHRLHQKSKRTYKRGLSGLHETIEMYFFIKRHRLLVSLYYPVEILSARNLNL